MILFFLMVFIFFLAIYALIGFKIFKFEQNPEMVKFMSFCTAGLFLSMACVFTATLIVEMNESYWWYGPAERMNWLVGITTFITLSSLIIGPIFGYRFAHSANRSTGCSSGIGRRMAPGWRNGHDSIQEKE